MSSARIAAQEVKKLTGDDLKVLSLLDRYLSRFEVFPRRTLEELTGFPSKHLDSILSSLEVRKLISIQDTPYPGVALLTAGLDALALYALSAEDIVVSFGNYIGVGKESDIFDGLGAGGERLSLKFFRIGRTSFTDTLRKRSYTSPESKVPWLLRSIKAAKREFQALERLYGEGVSVPKPLGRNRHVVVMEFLDGEVVAYSKGLINPRLVLERALEIVEDAYKVGVVNGDLSAFNLFVTMDERVLIIDWPQWIDRRKPRAMSKLYEDIDNLCLYFRRKYRVNLNPIQVYRRITGEAPSHLIRP
jgi:RIO kinase 2